MKAPLEVLTHAAATAGLSLPEYLACFEDAVRDGRAAAQARSERVNPYTAGTSPWAAFECGRRDLLTRQVLA